MSNLLLMNKKTYKELFEGVYIEADTFEFAIYKFAYKKDNIYKLWGNK